MQISYVRPRQYSRVLSRNFLTTVHPWNFYTDGVSDERGEVETFQPREFALEFVI